MTDLYRYTTDSLMAERRELSSSGGDTSLKALCENTAKRISTTGYLEFGPYWWAVKRILNSNGYNLGATDNPFMASRFTVQDDDAQTLTLIAAWRAADEIRDTYFHGSRDVPLDDEGEEVFSLFDPDMESPK